MCGFLFSLYMGDLRLEIRENINVISATVKRRGPDFSGEQFISVGNNWTCFINTSILWTQGDKLETQPVVNENNDVLLWNGDIYNTHTDRCPEISDTTFISDWLLKNDNNVIELLSAVSGPFSFVFWDRRKRILWTGRDAIGRHSLLWYLSKTEIFITSVACKSRLLPFVEVPAVGLFAINFREDMIIYDISLFPWSHYATDGRLTSYDLPENTTVKDSISRLDFGNVDWQTDDDDVPSSAYSSQFGKIPISEFMTSLLKNDKIFNNSSSPVIDFLDILKESVKVRVLTMPSLCRNCGDISIMSRCCCNHSKVAILFSGGIDCTVLAVLADAYVDEKESIDLLNVAFSRHEQNGDDNFDVPDRKTGLSSYQELKNLCPRRNWNFVEINVFGKELTENRENRIRHLIYPLNTVLDDSLGCALWFASRGIGTVNKLPYESTARILLSGLGADEQLGGYARHRVLLRQQGYGSLSRQLFEETVNISRRNLGRDNRITSDHGRQCRFPYLDENIIVYLNKIPPWQKHGSIDLPPGVGDKLLLRLAAWHLGLRTCAILPKRAMQFGCRIANSKNKGSSVSVNL